MASKNGSYMSNIGKSIRFGINAALESKLKPIYDIANDDNKEFLANIRDTVRDIRKGQNKLERITDVAFDKETADALKTGLPNALDDLKHFAKTGSIHRPKKSTEDDMFDMGDMDDFNFSEDDLDLSNLPPPDKAMEGVDENSSSFETTAAEIGANQIEAINAGTKAQVEIGAKTAAGITELTKATLDQSAVIAEGANGIVKTEMDIAKQSTKLQQILHKQQLEALQTINENVANIVAFNGDSVTKFTTAAIDYYSNSLDELRKISSTLERAFPEKKETDYGQSQMDRLGLGPNKAINLKSYFGQVKRNFMDKTQVGQFVGSFLDPMAIQALLANPMEMAAEFAADYLITKGLDDAMKAFSKSFSNFIPAALLKMGEYGDNWDTQDSWLKTAAQIFGITPERNKRNFGNYDKGPVPFDGITHRTINTVIPRYLSEIVGLLGGQRKMYDYTNGRFVDNKILKKNAETNRNWKVDNALGYEVRSEGDAYIDRLSKMTNMEGKSYIPDVAQTKKDFSDALIKMAESGTFIDLKNKKFLDSITSDKTIQAVLKTIGERQTKAQRMALASAALRYASDNYDENSRKLGEGDYGEIFANDGFDEIEDIYDKYEQIHKDKLEEILSDRTWRSKKENRDIVVKNGKYYRKSQEKLSENGGAGSEDRKIQDIISDSADIIGGKIDTTNTILSGIRDITYTMLSWGPWNIGGGGDSSGGGSRRRRRRRRATNGPITIKQFPTTSSEDSIISDLDDLADSLSSGSDDYDFDENKPNEAYESLKYQLEEEDDRKEIEDGRERVRQEIEEEERRDDTYREKFFTKLTRWMASPQKALIHALDSVSGTLYTLLFGDDNNEHGGSIIKKITTEIHDSFTNMWKTFKEEFINPLVAYFAFDKSKGIFKEIRDDIRGVEDENGVYKGGYLSSVWNMITGRKEEDEEKPTKKEAENAVKSGTNMARGGRISVDSRALFKNLTPGRGRFIWANEGETIVPAPGASTTDMLAEEKASQAGLLSNLFGGEHYADGGNVDVPKDADTNQNDEAFKKQVKSNINRFTREIFGAFLSNVFHTDDDDKAGDKSFKEQVGGVFKKGLMNFSNFFFGSNYKGEEGMKQFNDAFKKAAPRAVGRGIVLGGLTGLGLASGGFGLLGSVFMPGGPIGGALLAAGIGMLYESDRFKRFLFGKTDEKTGKHVGGIISKGTQDFFKNNKKTIMGGAAFGLFNSLTGFTGHILSFLGLGSSSAIGALPAMAIGGIGPIFFSTAVALAMKSRIVQERLFGKTDDESGERQKAGLLNNKVTDYMKSHVPQMVTGAGLGFLTAVGSNFGLLGGLTIAPYTGVILGGAIGLATASKRLKEYLFGRWDPHKKEYTSGGLVLRLQNFMTAHVMNPLKNFLDKQVFQTKKWFTKSILNPIVDAMGMYKIMLKKIFEAGAKQINKTFGVITGALETIFDPIIKPIRWAFNGLVSTVKKATGMFSDGMSGLVRSLLTIPVKLFTLPAFAYAGFNKDDEEVKSWFESRGKRDGQDDVKFKEDEKLLKKRIAARKENSKMLKERGYEATATQLAEKTAFKLEDIEEASKRIADRAEKQRDEIRDYTANINDLIKTITNDGVFIKDKAASEEAKRSVYRGAFGSKFDSKHGFQLGEIRPDEYVTNEQGVKGINRWNGSEDEFIPLDKAGKIKDINHYKKLDARLARMAKRKLRKQKAENFTELNDIDEREQKALYDAQGFNDVVKEDTPTPTPEKKSNFFSDLFNGKFFAKGGVIRTILNADHAGRGKKIAKAKVEERAKELDKLRNQINSRLNSSRLFASDDERNRDTSRLTASNIIAEQDNIISKILEDKKLNINRLAPFLMSGKLKEKENVKTEAYASDDERNRDTSRLTAASIVKERKEEEYQKRMLKAAEDSNKQNNKMEKKEESWWNKLLNFLMSGGLGGLITTALGALGVGAILTTLNNIWKWLQGDDTNTHENRVTADTLRMVARKGERALRAVFGTNPDYKKGYKAGAKVAEEEAAKRLANSGDELAEAGANAIEKNKVEEKFLKNRDKVKASRERIESLEIQLKNGNLSPEDSERLKRELGNEKNHLKQVRDNMISYKNQLDTMGKTGEELAEEESTGLFKKLKELFGKGIQSIEENKYVQKIMGGVENVKKFTGSLWNAFKRLKPVEIAGHLAKKIGLANLRTAGIETLGLANIAFGLYDIYSGINDAAEMFQIAPDKVTAGMRAACAALNVIMGLPFVCYVDLALELLYIGSSLVSPEPINIKRDMVRMIYLALPGAMDEKELSGLEKANQAEYQKYLATFKDEEDRKKNALTYDQWVAKQNEDSNFVVDKFRETRVGRFIFGGKDENGKSQPNIIDRTSTFLFGDQTATDESGNPAPVEGLLPKWYRKTNEFIDSMGKVFDDFMAEDFDGKIALMWKLFIGGYDKESGIYEKGLIGKAWNSISETFVSGLEGAGETLIDEFMNIKKDPLAVLDLPIRLPMNLVFKMLGIDPVDSIIGSAIHKGIDLFLNLPVFQRLGKFVDNVCNTFDTAYNEAKIKFEEVGPINGILTFFRSFLTNIFEVEPATQTVAMPFIRLTDGISWFFGKVNEFIDHAQKTFTEGAEEFEKAEGISAKLDVITKFTKRLFDLPEDESLIKGAYDKLGTAMTEAFDYVSGKWNEATEWWRKFKIRDFALSFLPDKIRNAIMDTIEHNERLNYSSNGGGSNDEEKGFFSRLAEYAKRKSDTVEGKALNATGSGSGPGEYGGSGYQLPPNVAARQDVGPWAKKTLPGGGSVADEGCAPIALSNALGVDPSRAIQLVHVTDRPDVGGGVTGDYFKHAANASGSNFQNIDPDDPKAFEKFIANRGIIGGKSSFSGPFTPAGHFLTTAGGFRDKNGVQWVRTIDPMTGNSSMIRFDDLKNGALDPSGPMTMGVFKKSARKTALSMSSGYGRGRRRYGGSGTDYWVEQNGAVSSDGARDETMAAVDSLGKWFKEKTGKKLVVTAITNGQHAPGQYSHAAGWKADVNDWYGPEGLSGEWLITDNNTPGSLAVDFEKYGNSLGLGMNFENDHYDVSAAGEQWAPRTEDNYKGNLGGFNGKGATAGSKSGGETDVLTTIGSRLAQIGKNYAMSVMMGKEYTGTNFTDNGSFGDSANAIVTGENAKDTWKFLKQQGFSDAEAAGIMANFQAESGLDPQRVQGAGHQRAPEITVDGKTGYGLAQWTYETRQQDLLNYAKSKGKSSGALDTQLEFFWKEVQGYPTISEMHAGAQDPETQAEIFMNTYEKPGVEHLSERKSNARQFYSQFGGSGFGRYGGSGAGRYAKDLAMLGTSDPAKVKGLIPSLTNKLKLKFDTFGNILGLTIPDHNRITANDTDDSKYAKQRKQIQFYYEYGGEDPVLTTTSSTPTKKDNITKLNAKTLTGDEPAKMAKQLGLKFDDLGNVLGIKLPTDKFLILPEDNDEIKYQKQATQIANFKEWKLEDKEDKKKEEKPTKKDKIYEKNKDKLKAKTLTGDEPAKMAKELGLKFDDLGNVIGIKVPDDKYLILPEDSDEIKYQKQATQIANYNEWKLKENDTKTTETIKANSNGSIVDNTVTKATSTSETALVNAIRALDLHPEMNAVISLLGEIAKKSGISGSEVSRATASKNKATAPMQQINAAKQAGLAKETNNTPSKAKSNPNNNYATIHAKNMQIARGGEFAVS